VGVHRWRGNGYRVWFDFFALLFEVAQFYLILAAAIVLMFGRKNLANSIFFRQYWCNRERPTAVKHQEYCGKVAEYFFYMGEMFMY